MVKQVDYAKQVARVKELEEENKRLEEHYVNSIHTDLIAEKAGEDPEYYRNVCCADTLGSMIKENKRLKKENEDLKFEKGLLTGELPLSCGVAPDGGDTYVRRQLEKENEQLTNELLKGDEKQKETWTIGFEEGKEFAKDEIKELQEENEQLKETCDNLNNSVMGISHEYEVLSDKMSNDNLNFGDCLSQREDEIKELEKEIEDLKGELGALGDGYNAMKNEYEELKKERNILEKSVRYEHSSCYDGRMMLVKTLWGEEYKEKIDLDFPFINEEIKKLKEENDITKKAYAHDYKTASMGRELLRKTLWGDNQTEYEDPPNFDPTYETINDEVKKLKEELEQLKIQ